VGREEKSWKFRVTDSKGFPHRGTRGRGITMRGKGRRQLNKGGFQRKKEYPGQRERGANEKNADYRYGFAKGLMIMFAGKIGGDQATSRKRGIGGGELLRLQKKRGWTSKII